MIFKNDRAEIDVRENMRGGSGKVTIKKHIPGDAMHGRCRLCGTLIIEPGCGIGFHSHNEEYEIFIIQKGTGMVDDNGSKAQVGPGDAVFTGGGAGHAISNTGNEPMEVTAVIIT
jgi:mannose-6-phosphate isomerase-like protein (cupin superfamily)